MLLNKQLVTIGIFAEMNHLLQQVSQLRRSFLLLESLLFDSSCCSDGSSTVVTWSQCCILNCPMLLTDCKRMIDAAQALQAASSSLLQMATATASGPCLAGPEVMTLE